MASVIVKSRAGLATMIQNDILPGRISADEAVKILACYLIREGTITEITLASPTE